jgi:hypothetical protein
MSTWYYVIEQSWRVYQENGTKVKRPVGANVIFQIDIPIGNNPAGKSWRNCVLDRVDPERSGVTSEVPQIQIDFVDQYNKLQDGSAYEISERVNFSSAYLTPAQRNAEIQARAQEIDVHLIEELQIEFEWTGYEGTVT